MSKDNGADPKKKPVDKPEDRWLNGAGREWMVRRAKDFAESTGREGSPGRSDSYPKKQK